jgi:hypothetical protein
MSGILPHFGLVTGREGPATAAVWIRGFPFVYSDAVPVILVDHPLVHDTLLGLRDAATGPEKFRRLAMRISVLLVAEAMRDLPTKPTEVLPESATSACNATKRPPSRRSTTPSCQRAWSTATS